MAMVVKNNMSAVRTLNTLNKNSSALQKSLAKVSSGMKINSAQDDASGYAISERMRVQIRSLDQANQNTQNASSLMKTAEGAVSSTMEILKSLKEKAVNAATDTNTDQDRATIQKELNQFIDQIDDNALTTFNGKFLVDGSKSQIGNDTATTMTNQSLGLYEADGETELTGETKLTNLTNRNGENLEIATTDSVTASFVMDGKTYTTTFKVEGNELKDIFTKLNEEYKSVSGATDVAISEGVLDPSVVAAKEKLAAATEAEKTAKTKRDAVKSAMDAVNNVADAVISNISSLNSVQNNSFGGDSWNSPTSYTSDFAAAKTAVTNWVDDFRVDGDNQNNPTTNFDYNGFVNNAYSPMAAGLPKNIVHSTFAYSWSLGTYGPTAIGNAVTNYTSLLATYNSAVSNTGKLSDLESAYSQAQSETQKAQSAYDAAIAANPPSDMVNRSDLIGKNSFDDKVYTNDGEIGLTITAEKAGIQTQISGLTLSITDSEGNVKKSANAALDAFKTTIYAKNKSDANELTFQVGASANQAITVGLDDMRAEALGLKGTDGSKVSVATQDKANAAIAVFDNAIQKVLDHQATIGAIEARLEYTSQNLTTSSENVQAAESTIRDADMAKEMTEYTKNNVLLQAAQSMLAQANQNSSAVLSLLQ